MFTPFHRGKVRKDIATPRNWEANIHDVTIEQCAAGEDPLGYRAVFYLEQYLAQENRRKSFAVGASFLAQRKHNLRKAGYAAPMTKKAIDMLEERLGEPLPGSEEVRAFG